MFLSVSYCMSPIMTVNSCRTESWRGVCGGRGEQVDQGALRASRPVVPVVPVSGCQPEPRGHGDFTVQLGRGRCLTTVEGRMRECAPTNVAARLLLAQFLWQPHLKGPKDLLPHRGPIVHHHALPRNAHHVQLARPGAGRGQGLGWGGGARVVCIGLGLGACAQLRAHPWRRRVRASGTLGAAAGPSAAQAAGPAGCDACCGALARRLQAPSRSRARACGLLTQLLTRRWAWTGGR